MSIDTPPRQEKETKEPGMAGAMFGGEAGANWVRNPREAYNELVKLLGPVGIYPVLILLGISVVERFDQAAFGLLGPEIRDSFHLTNASYLAITTTGGLLPLFLSAHVGYFTDRTHRVRFGTIGALIWVVMSVFTGLAPVVLILFFARLGSGMGALVNTPVHQSLIADYYPPEALAPTFSLLLVAGAAVGLTTGPVAGAIGQWLGWRATFVLLALPTLVFVYLMSRLREPKRGESLGADFGAEERPSFNEGFRRVKAIRSLKRTWFSSFFFGSGVVAFASLSALYFKDVFHLGPAARGYYAAISGVTGLLGLGIGGVVSQRVMRRGRPELLPVINGVMVLQAASGMVLLALSPNVVLAVASTAFLTIGLAGFSPSYTIMVAIVAPPRLRGQAISYSLLFVTLGSIIIAPTIGAIGDSIGERNAMVILGVLVGASGLVEITARKFVRRDVAEAVKLVAASESKAMLSCHGLDVAYEGGVQVLFGVDFEVNEGEIIALLGTNGAGKSTLLRAVSGLMDPIGGAIFYNGRDITHADAVTKAALGIVQVPGGRGVFPGLTVAENLRLAGWMYRRDQAYLKEATARVLEYFPILKEYWELPAANLSGGQQQMLTLAQALLAKPKLLMIDELTLGLAPVVVEQLLQTVRRLAEDGTTIVLVEQSVNLALNVANTAYFMEKGEIRFTGPTAELLERPDVLRSVFLEGAGTYSDEDGVEEKKGLPAQARKPRRVLSTDREAALSVRGLSKRFGGVAAVSDVDFDLWEGEILGVIGPNGAGKTTVFDLISGFTPSDAGKIVLHGLDVSEYGADVRARLGLGRSFQDARLFPALTVSDTIAVSLERKLEVRDPVAIALGVPEVVDAEKKTADRVEELIDLMGLHAFRDKFVSELSTGSRRIVDLACILAHEPSVILFDEPSSGIAQRETEALGPLLLRIREATNASLLVIEHDMPLITSISDEIVALDLGRVVTRGTAEEVKGDARVIASYLGSTAEVVNRSGARVVEPGADAPEVETPAPKKKRASTNGNRRKGVS
jgi:ABC-type branched-subunit amino acid transport system ATPase component/predicted MFS family arabinose efflux permease